MSAKIEAVRLSLLALHKSLIDLARAEHEKTHGKKLTPGELLQLLTSDHAFDWLHPFSLLIVAIDELLERDTPPTDEETAAVRLEVERLLNAGQGRYEAAVQRDPSVALEAARTQAALEQLPASTPEQHEALLATRSKWRGQRRRPGKPKN